MFVISYWLMYNFFKILSSSRYSYIFDQIIFQAQQTNENKLDQGTWTRCPLIALTTSAALPLKNHKIKR